MKTTRNIKRAFMAKKSRIGQRLRNEFIDNGIATIPCRTSEFEDIISRYSVKGYETMNPEFRDYVNDIAECIPEEYPIVLDITGHSFTKEEQNVIEDTIKADYAYDLGTTEASLRHERNTFLFTLIGTILCSILLVYSDWLSDIPLEFLFVLYWYMCDTLVDYLFIGGYDLRKEQMLAGRLACIKVFFSEEFDEADYTGQEAGQIIDEIVTEAEEDRKRIIDPR